MLNVQVRVWLPFSTHTTFASKPPSLMGCSKHGVLLAVMLSLGCIFPEMGHSWGASEDDVLLAIAAPAEVSSL